MYSLPGTDGCDYVRSDTFERVKFANFYTPEIESLRTSVMQGNTDKQEYQQWFQEVTDNLPGVHHYSWYNIKRKIRTYRGYWSKHWQSLYDIQQEDTSENNMFFNKPWSDVTEDEIDSLADRLASEMGGWIFHTKIDFNQTTPHIVLTQGQPKIAKEWTDK